MCCNRFIGHIAFGGDSWEDDARCKKRDEQVDKKDKIIANDEGTNDNKKPSASCNYFMINYYTILKKMYLFLWRVAFII